VALEQYVRPRIQKQVTGMVKYSWEMNVLIHLGNPGSITASNAGIDDQGDSKVKKRWGR